MNEGLSLGEAIAWIIAFGGLMWLFRWVTVKMRVVDNITDEVLRFENNRIAQKQHKLKG